MPSLNEPRFTDLIRQAKDCRCVAVIEPSDTVFKKWEVFAATTLPNAKVIRPGKTLDEVGVMELGIDQ